jgi:precorrin-3B C17-methyltransferase
MSRRATDVLAEVDAVAGYTTYIDLIQDLIGEKEVIATAMTKEVDRVAAAIDIALSGRSCAIVSSGDPGIYAMAGLAFEMCREKKITVSPAGTDSGGSANAEKQLQIEVVPGIPALCAGAALLGAPLTHDFAVISLSDLLTPWETIEKRLAAASDADFVIVLYNPKSRRRSGHLEKAQKIVLQFRDSRTPVGIVKRANREGQVVTFCDLEGLHRADVDMQTIVFIGSSTSVRYLDFMVTPRGYAAKYTIDGKID